MRYFQGFAKIKYYIMAVMTLLGIYTYQSIAGIKMMGDDNDSKEEYSGHGGTSSYHHK